MSLFTRRQRGLALVFGIVCHLSFAAAVGVMAWRLYVGMSGGLFHLTGATALAMNLLLLLQFPLLHSLLLTPQGGRWLGSLAPAGLGEHLRTTLFAIAASLQLLAIFLLWSPLSPVWIEFSGLARLFLTTAYAGAWVLLAVTMYHAGLDVQMGYLGWWSVWKNRLPKFQPFQVRSSFRYSRHPMYLAYALILWTGPVWNLDHLLFAGCWSLYCVIAPLHKERRYRFRYGERYRIYQRSVPYFLPKRPQNVAPSGPPVDCDVFICGAGPVGLLLANLLGKQGIRCVVAEKRVEAPSQSMAIGITPPSLHLLGTVGLDRAFLQAGLPIETAWIHENQETLGSVGFDQLPGKFPYILSLPQRESCRLLQEQLAQDDHVSLRTGWELTELSQDATGVTVTSSNGERLRARWLVGCDGQHSMVRRLSRIRIREHFYRPQFVMADFVGSPELGDEAHLFFGPNGSVESFPLPGGARRWIVMCDSTPPCPKDQLSWIEEQVLKKTGYRIEPLPDSPANFFHPKRMRANRFARGRVALCGDAAHVLSPIGGQGLNTGFADAGLLAQALDDLVHHGASAPQWWRVYHRQRVRAFSTARTRAAAGMWLGTRSGARNSRLRRWFILRVLMRPRIRAALAPTFAMLNVPYSPVPEI